MSSVKIQSIPYLLTTILTVCSLSICSVPAQLSTIPPSPPVLPTPWRPWIVGNASHPCILAKFGAEFFVNTTKIQTNIIVNPLKAQVGKDSKCGSDIQILQLVFDGNSLSFSFERDGQNVFISKVVFYFGTTGMTVVYKEELFKTPLKFGYKCFKEQVIRLSDSVVMNVENVRLEAFKAKKYNISDDSPEQWERVGLKCPLDRIKSDAWQISGISVGVGVALLSFITLVAIWSGRQQEKVMLKVKMMRQWTVEENLANLNMLAKRPNQKGPVQNELTWSNSNKNPTGIENPGYADHEHFTRL